VRREIVNASPLSLFSRIARLDLIERLAPAILVPDAVIEEVRVGEHKDPTAATAVEWAERFQGSFLGKVVWSLRTKALLGVLGERCLLGSILI
jgi:predicted nucleic acid-binding protein